MFRPLYLQGKSSWYVLDRRLGGLQSWSGRGGKEKNSQPLRGLELLIIQSISQRCTTELPRLFSKRFPLLKFRESLVPFSPNPLSSGLLSKDAKIKMYGIIILPVVLYGCETFSQYKERTRTEGV
jgi:hypothetical protein